MSETKPVISESVGFKEMFNRIHTGLIDQYMEKHPTYSYTDAVNQTHDRAWTQAVDEYSDMCDAVFNRSKAEKL